MTDTPLWQQQRDAMQAEAQAAAPSTPPLTRAQIAQDLARYGHDPSVLLNEWDTYTPRIGQGPLDPPLSDADCALGGPDLTIAERAAIRRVLGQNGGPVAGRTIDRIAYRPARPDEAPDLWVSDAREGGDCQGYVRR
jgi:hypothetical protein